MVIDTSALVAMLNDEPEAEKFETAVEAHPVRLMSTASNLETAIVIEARFGEPGGRELDLGCIAPQSTLSASMPIRRMLHESRTECTARDGTAPV